MYAIFAHQLKLQPKPLIIILALIVPIFSIICATFNLPFSLTTLAFIISIIISMIYEIFFPGNDSGNLFEYSSARVANTTLILTYVGFLLSFVSRMTVWESSRWFLILFLLMVYGCDSFAWFFGIILGKNNRGFIKASPNKSIAGFIGGISTSILCGILAHYMFPEIFTSLWKVIVLGLFTSVAAIFGDLIESVFKRGSAFKDSGQVIPGRGGILDSIDSILIAAPIYYFCSKLFFGL
jgi:phosphatidate cytidylyltransferase